MFWAGVSGNNAHIAHGGLVLKEGLDWGITNNVSAFI